MLIHSTMVITLPRGSKVFYVILAEIPTSSDQTVVLTLIEAPFSLQTLPNRLIDERIAYKAVIPEINERGVQTINSTVCLPESLPAVGQTVEDHGIRLYTVPPF